MKKIQCFLLEKNDLTFDGQAKAHNGKPNLLAIKDLKIPVKLIRKAKIIMFENYVVKNQFGPTGWIKRDKWQGQTTEAQMDLNFSE